MAHIGILLSVPIGLISNVFWATPFALAAVFLYLDWFLTGEWALKRISDRRQRRLLEIGILALIILVSWPSVIAIYHAQMANRTEGDIVLSGAWDRAVRFGKSGATIAFAPPNNLLWKPYPDAPFEIQRGVNGIGITTSIRDRNGNLALDIKDGHWTVYPNFILDKNSTREALEVKDTSGHVIFQFMFLNNTMEVQGEWWSDEGRGVRLVEETNQLNSGTYFIPLTPSNQHNEALIKPIFRYPSKDHWRELGD